MKLEELFAIVRAQFACKNPHQKLLKADAVESNIELPILFFCHVARETEHTPDETADFLGITWVRVRRHLKEADRLEIGNESLRADHQYKRKMALIHNGIRIHQLTPKPENYFSQSSK